VSNKKDFWIKKIGEEWYTFYPELWDSKYMENVLGYISSRYKQATLYPKWEDLFKSFKLTPFDNLKVVIIGQDPYPNEQNGTPVATGLAFANNGLEISPSLSKIRDTIEREVYDGFNISFDYSLEEWASQGVLLLNTSLTFEKFKGGHFNIWEDFTKSILKKLNDINGLHVCLWGKHAKSFKYLLDNKKIFIYEEVHPAYAARNNKDWHCNHFKEINKMIYKQNGKEEIIAW
jgi:uracil-DNA glycosylase